VCTNATLLESMYENCRDSFRNTDIGHFVSEQKTLMRIKGVVIEPSFVQAVVSSVLPWKEAEGDMKRSQFLLKVKATEGRSRGYKLGGVVRVRVYDHEPPALRYGQEVEILGDVYAPPRPRNPGQIDYKSYLQGRLPSIRAIANVQGRQNVKVLANGQGNPFFHLVYFLKERMAAGITRSALPDSAATMVALVWGVREEIPREVLDDFIKTGTYHFLAVSGMQVGMLVITLHFFLLLIKIPRRHIALVVMSASVLYAFLTGLEPPVLRATFLTVFCYGALLVKRDWDLPNGTSAAVLVTLLFNPSDLFNPSFQLSLAGFLGLVYLAHRIESLLWGSSLLLESLRSPEERSKFWLIWVYSRKAFCVSTGAWMVTAPLVLYYFHIFTSWGAILSLLLTPMVWVLTIGGFCLSILGQLSVTAAIPLAYLAEGADVLMKGIISWSSSVPFTCLYGPSPSWPWLMVFYIVGTLAFLVNGLGVRLAYIAGGLLLVGNIYFYSEMLLGHKSSMRVVVLDVGHGSCVFVEFPNGRTMIYDAGSRGSFDVGHYIIAPFLWQQGVKKIDLVVVSHEDEDHFDALPFLTKGFGIGKVLVSNHLIDSKRGQPLIDFLKYRGIKVEEVQEGVEIDELGEARVRVLNPPPDNLSLSANDASCVLRIDYQGHSMLLCGDIEGQTMGRFIASEAQMGADIVMAPHHGSYVANLGKFLERVSPEYIVVSAERKNLHHFTTHGKVLSTFEAGAVSFTVEKGAIKANSYLTDVSSAKKRGMAMVITQ
ncbi:MAG TPA: DNA internalization-related competence protein ComEC/Rec2, partial [Candidatus Hypogeohydataceae bacterium YC40]